MELRYEFYIAALPKKVWEVIVSPEGSRQVYGAVLESTFKVGDPFEYVGPGGEGDRTVHVYGVILDFVPESVLSATHHTGKVYAAAEGERYESRVTFSLQPIGNSTRLTLVHDQFQDSDPSYWTSAGSWPMILSNTKSVVETGRAMKLY